MSENEQVCECCCENPVGELGREHGYAYCDDCCAWKWLEQTIEVITMAASANNWCNANDSQAQTGTRYLSFFRGESTLTIRDLERATRPFFAARRH